MSDVSWWDARAIAETVMPTGPTEQVRLGQALGRTLCADARAAVDLPGFATAAMDGWVVAGTGPWSIVGTIDTGTPAEVSLREGQAMRIATGGAVPVGAESVVPWEVARVDGDVVAAEIPDKLHIRPRGEECVVGDVLARRTDVVNPALLGSLAAAGLDHLETFRQPAVTVLIAGDEVVLSGIPQTGQVRDALGVQLPGWIEAYGGLVREVIGVRDDPEVFTQALDAAAHESDFVIVTGGTARGHRDYLRSTLQKMDATLHVDGVAVRPGHPMTLATVGLTPVVGLPGNPLSALVAMVTLVEPIVDGWNGRAGRALPRVQMAEAIDASRKPLTRLMVGRRELGGFRQVQHVSSAMLRGIAHADGWAVVPPEGADEGQILAWIPVPWNRRTSDDS